MQSLSGVLDESRRIARQKLYRASLLCAAFIIVEVIGGLLSGSLAILSDAAHLSSDLASFLVAIVANHMASLPATQQHTFGLKRAESLAALFSILSLVLVTLGLIVEAFRRFTHYDGQEAQGGQVNGTIMTIIAFIGVFVNIVLAYVLGGNENSKSGTDEGFFGGLAHGHSHADGFMCAHELMGGHDVSRDAGDDEEERVCLVASSSGDEDQEQGRKVRFKPFQIRTATRKTPKPTRNVNIHAAFLHVLADLAQSVAVLIAGCIIWVKPSWSILDPVLTVCFSLLVIRSSLGMIRSSIAVLLEEIPMGISWKDVYNAIDSVPSVQQVHNLRIWSVSAGQPAMMVHCVSDDPKALTNIEKAIGRFSFQFSSIQIQRNAGVCLTCQGSEQVELPESTTIGLGKIFAKSA